MSDIARIDNKVEIKEAASHEDKIRLLEQLFSRKIHGSGKILTPDDGFYVQTNTVEGLWHISTRIFEWLGLDPNDLVIDYSDEIEPPGLFFRDNGTSYIYINSKHRENPFEVSAILAHEIMHYVLLTFLNVALEETHDNEQFTDVATIYSGLGILVLNGFSYDSGWVETAIAAMFGALRIRTQTLSFGYYKPKQYAKMFALYLDSHGLSAKDSAPYFLPGTKHFLPVGLRASGLSKKKPAYVVASVKSSRIQKATKLGAIILMIPVAGLFWWLRTGMSTSSTSPQVNQVLVEELKSQRAEVDACYSKLRVLESSVDTTSADSVNNYNNNLDVCKGLKDNYNARISEQK